MFGLRFIKFQPTEYILKYKNGKVVREGAGLSFFYYAPTTSLVAIPIASSDTPFIFEEITSDFQTVSVQGQVAFRIANPSKTAQLLNFTCDSRSKRYLSEDPEKLPQRVLNIVKVLTKKYIQGMKLKEALVSIESLAHNIGNDIKTNDEIASLGLEMLGLSILAILPNKETSRALEAQAREEILKKADEAVYERRNASIEQERRIKETQLESDRIVQKKQNELRDSQLIFDTSLEEKKEKLVGLAAANSKAEADARAYGLQAIMKALENVSPNVIQSLAGMGMQPNKLIAVAFRELAEKAEKIGTLNISPDLLQTLLKETSEYETTHGK
ncbi:MAG: SPFH domain-containing protein [Planctomycetes bacterium]|nr:SPFH domain-containing protein [Planctomycetota bacterium]